MKTLFIIAAFNVLLSTNQVASAEHAVSARQHARVLFGFDSADSAKEWQIVNDGVMGGRSTSSLEAVSDGLVRFAGNLSLENNGGFASVRSKPTTFGLKSSQTIVARLRGDGRRYILNLYVPDRQMAFSYQAEFETKRDEWTEVRLPLSSFVATSFGRRVEDKQLAASKVNSVGIMLADKTSGEFQLMIDWIRVESK